VLEQLEAKNTSNLASIKKTIVATLVQAEEHALSVETYLGKSKIVRKNNVLERILVWSSVKLNYFFKSTALLFLSHI
jgi:hypothetical protein